MQSQSPIRIALTIFAAGFLALFLLRFGFGYLAGDSTPNFILQDQSNYGGGWEFATDIKNYASLKRKLSAAAAPAGAGAQVGGDQKYEKVANIGLKSAEFEKEEERIRQLIGEKDALIQFEQRHGLKGHRSLRLAIGVDPKFFDAFVEKVQTFGELTRLTIDKADKTNEYRDLQAKRRALEKTREALAALKNRDGEMRALIELEQQILSLEQQIQGLGVSLGDFDAENEFVTVKMLLAEAKVVKASVHPLLVLGFESFTWVLFYYPLIWLGIAACAVSVFIGVHLLRLAGRMFAAADARVAKP
ncbi:MAG: DUF4349 domain-containing protein [Alphaproteobacteria bacterium]|nr:DUF4349 domain-containing protein [Alphaproteobacteria bacterium]